MYNKEFKLTVRDLELIENALISVMNESDNKNEIHQLLGKLHNQKVWYRPKSSTYIGG